MGNPKKTKKSKVDSKTPSINIYFKINCTDMMLNKTLGQHLLKNPLIVNSIVEKVFKEM